MEFTLTKKLDYAFFCDLLGSCNPRETPEKQLEWARNASQVVSAVLAAAIGGDVGGLVAHTKFEQWVADDLVNSDCGDGVLNIASYIEDARKREAESA